MHSLRLWCHAWASLAVYNPADALKDLALLKHGISWHASAVSKRSVIYFATTEVFSILGVFFSYLRYMSCEVSSDVASWRLQGVVEHSIFHASPAK